MGGDGVMVGENVDKFGEKRRFGKLAVGNKKNGEAEGRETRWGGDKDGIAMGASFYQRDVL